ncbi:hypothetical protein C8R44DRAFT_743015 [Mycena epipterygia]|nr:hypothetical protein C8R44DRAFT_743015 [Mycena epipterygia]
MQKDQWFQPTVMNGLSKVIILANFSIEHGKFYDLSEYLHQFYIARSIDKYLPQTIESTNLKILSKGEYEWGHCRRVGSTSGTEGSFEVRLEESGETIAEIYWNNPLFGNNILEKRNVMSGYDISFDDFSIPSGSEEETGVQYWINTPQGDGQAAQAIIPVPKDGSSKVRYLHPVVIPTSTQSNHSKRQSQARKNEVVVQQRQSRDATEMASHICDCVMHLFLPATYPPLFALHPARVRALTPPRMPPDAVPTYLPPSRAPRPHVPAARLDYDSARRRFARRARIPLGGLPRMTARCVEILPVIDGVVPLERTCRRPQCSLRVSAAKPWLRCGVKDDTFCAHLIRMERVARDRDASARFSFRNPVPD